MCRKQLPIQKFFYNKQRLSLLRNRGYAEETRWRCKVEWFLVYKRWWYKLATTIKTKYMQIRAVTHPVYLNRHVPNKKTRCTIIKWIHENGLHSLVMWKFFLCLKGFFFQKRLKFCLTFRLTFLLLYFCVP